MASMTQQTFEPVRINRTDGQEEEREVLFILDDDDGKPVEYTIPKKIRPNITIRYLQDTYDKGQEFALAAAMREVLGADAMEALADSEDVGEEEMQAIMNIVERKLLSQMNKALGKSQRGRRR
jgi:hypothetical protein